MGIVPPPAPPEPGNGRPATPTGRWPDRSTDPLATAAGAAGPRLAALATADSWRPPTAAHLLGLVRRVPFAIQVLVAVLVLGVCGGLAAMRLSGRGGAGSAGAAEALVPRAVRVTTPAETSSSAADGATAGVVVHVAGAVATPGVQHLPVGARVGDAVTAAGGPTPAADLGRVNLAAPLTDGTQVYVPATGETVPAVVDPAGAGGSSGASVATSHEEQPVDLNTAAEADLEELPGIGPAIAAAIVRYRTEHRFAMVDDLLDVPGIGPAKLEALRERVRV